jgi:hypothetical protein
MLKRAKKLRPRLFGTLWPEAYLVRGSVLCISPDWNENESYTLTMKNTGVYSCFVPNSSAELEATLHDTK